MSDLATFPVGTRVRSRLAPARVGTVDRVSALDEPAVSWDDGGGGYCVVEELERVDDSAPADAETARERSGTEMAGATVEMSRAEVQGMRDDIARLRALLRRCQPVLANHQCEDQQEGDELIALEADITAALPPVLLGMGAEGERQAFPVGTRVRDREMPERTGTVDRVFMGQPVVAWDDSVVSFCPEERLERIPAPPSGRPTPGCVPGSETEARWGWSDVTKERTRQDSKWGVSRNLHPQLWLAVLMEEVGEVGRAILAGDRGNYREELVQVAAVALAAIQDIDWQTRWREQLPPPQVVAFAWERAEGDGR